MQPASPEFENDTFAAFNSLRMVAHCLQREDTTIEAIDDRSVRVEAHQCVVAIAHGAADIRIDVRPREGLEHGQIPNSFVVDHAAIHGSPLVNCSIDELPRKLRSALADVLDAAGINWFSHDGQETCVVHRVIEGDRLLAAQRVEAITRGIDALTGLPTTYMRNPGLGAPAAIVPLSATGEPAAIPSEQDPDSDRRAAGARIRMAARWAGSLPDTFVITRREGEAGTFSLSCYALTMTPPEDRSTALRESVAAYMALAATPEPRDPE
jgi:hypothetical protein